VKILVSITTTGNPDFNKRIGQIKELAIDEIALFVTAIGFDKRKELYKLLKKSTIKKIPFVHLRSDMKVDEVDYLVDNFGTEIFNIHGKNGPPYPFNNDLSKYADKIYLETQYQRQDMDELNKYAGICLDASHLEDFRRAFSLSYPYYVDLMKKYRVGCGHISAVKNWPWYSFGYRRFIFSSHIFYKLSQFNYLKRYKNILAPVMALELENDIVEQLEAKKYIETILS
jgi:hypothetical protein